VDQAGRYRTRLGHHKYASLTGADSLYGCPLGTYVHASGTLSRVSSTGALTTVKTGLTGPLAFEYALGQLWFCDRYTTWVIGADLVVRPWGTPVAATPTLTAVGGGLTAGVYRVQVTQIGTDGLEGGVSDAAEITLTGSGQGIRVTLAAAPVVSRVYATSANGTHPYAVGQGSGSLDVITTFGDGEPAPTRFVKPPPCGTQIDYFAGRMYVTSGNTVWYSQGFQPHRFNMAAGFFQFPAPVTVFAPVSDGLWVVADMTYFRAGKNPDENAQWIPQLNYAAMAGDSTKVPYDNDQIWMSSRGLVRGAEGGQLKNIQEANVAPYPGYQVAICLREVRGQRLATVSYIPSGANAFQNPEWATRGTGII
jgi:hypothetical protein